MEVPIEELRPCPRNDDLYRPPSDDDADFITILAGIRRKGQLVPATITKDRMIMDGHRRFFACRRLGIPTLKCIVRDKYSWDVTPADLAEYNRQRVKTSDELVREEIALADPDESYEALLEERDRRLQQYDHLENIEILGTKKRWKFSESQTKPFVDAVAKYVLERKQYWPLTDRRVHYGILDIRGLLRNYGKRKTPYENDEDSYKRLCDILVRMRLANIIPMHSIEDETRPVAVWDCYKHVGAFTSRQLDDFLANYSRDLMQSQQDHFEIVGEKMTIESIIRPIAAHFCIPYTIGRGYSSLPPRAKMAGRFRRSGKRHLVLLTLADFDPEGEDIGHAFARSMRDDFGLDRIVPIKVALTHTQVEEYRLPPKFKAKKDSSRRDGFVQKYGENVHELEALPPEVLDKILQDAIDSVINIDAFNAQVGTEKSEATYLRGVRKVMQEKLVRLVPPIREIPSRESDQ